MNTLASPYRGYRFPSEIISYRVWLYFRFSVSCRDVGVLMAERGVIVTYETIRVWCERFGRDYDKRIRARRGKLGDTWHLDDVFIRIGGRLQYLWRAVDQDGGVLDKLVQSRRSKKAAARFFTLLTPRVAQQILGREGRRRVIALAGQNRGQFIVVHTHRSPIKLRRRFGVHFAIREPCG